MIEIVRGEPPRRGDGFADAFFETHLQPLIDTIRDRIHTQPAEAPLN